MNIPDVWELHVTIPPTEFSPADHVVLNRHTEEGAINTANRLRGMGRLVIVYKVIKTKLDF